MISADGKFRVTVDTSRTPDLYEFGQRVKETMERWYKPLRDLLYSPATKEIYEITVTFNPNEKGSMVQSLQGLWITAGADWARKNQNVDPFVRTMISFIQNYNSNTPGWIRSGTADFAFHYKYKGIQLDEPNGCCDNYNSGDDVSAYFFNYVKNNVRSDILSQVNEAARKGTYQDTLWKQMTGKDLSTLWNDMNQNLG